MRLKKEEIKALTKRLIKRVKENNYYLDGVDDGWLYSNGKTKHFVEKVETIDFDMINEIIVDMLTIENYSCLSSGRNWKEEDCHIFLDKSGSISDFYRRKGIDINSNLYLKVFKFGEGQIPCFVIHD